MTAVLEPGSDAWLQHMSPSKAAAVLGVSPYESPLSMWNLMAGITVKDPTSKVQARGHYLEPAILAWFFDQHPELIRVEDNPTRFHPTLPWAANMDAEAIRGGFGVTERFSVEAKSDAIGDDRWGTPSTDEIPPYYVAQAMCSMHITGHRTTYFPIITARLEFVEYIVHYDEDWATNVMEPALTAFMDSLTTGVRPPLDGHPATYESIKKSHPDIVDSYVKLPPATALEYLEARDAAKAAQARADTARNVVLDLMGSARIAKCGDVKVARRQGTRGAPALYDCKAAATDITLTHEQDAA